MSSEIDNETKVACDVNPKNKYSMVLMSQQMKVRPDVFAAVVLDYMDGLYNDISNNISEFGTILVCKDMSDDLSPLKYIEFLTFHMNNEEKVRDIVFNEAVRDDLRDIINSGKEKDGKDS